VWGAHVDLNRWPRSKKVPGNNPLHTLLKSMAATCMTGLGSYAASRALRHADIAITGKHYGQIRMFDMDGSTPVNGRVFVHMGPGGSDGIRSDRDGNVWSAAGGGGAGFDGVHCYGPGGDLPADSSKASTFWINLPRFLSPYLKALDKYSGKIEAQ
jgi:hypothetical protein